jgi:hypothetical protein
MNVLVRYCYNTLDERVAKDKNYSISGPFISYKENEYLTINP